MRGGDRSILLDAGLSCREISRRLAEVGEDPARLCGVFISHEHSDHVQGVPLLSRKYRLPVYVNRPTHEEILCRRRDFSLPSVQHFETGDTLDFDGLSVRTFSVSHDAADPVGFVIGWEGMRVGVATDVGAPTRLLVERLRACDALVIESNHDLEMLDAGPYPQELKRRIKGNRGHLSNSQCAELLRELYHPAMSHVVLAHLSETNNTPVLAYSAACRSLPAAERHPTRIIVASQSRPAALHLSRTGQEVGA